MAEYWREIFCFSFGLLVAAFITNLRRKKRKDDCIGGKHEFAVDQEKFSTQRTVTYCLLIQFGLTAVQVFWNNDQSERSMMLQTIINLTLLAVGYWLGSSKQSQDQTQTMGDIAKSAPDLARNVPPQVTPDLAAAHDGVIPAAEATGKTEGKG